MGKRREFDFELPQFEPGTIRLVSETPFNKTFRIEPSVTVSISTNYTDSGRYEVHVQDSELNSRNCVFGLYTTLLPSFLDLYGFKVPLTEASKDQLTQYFRIHIVDRFNENSGSKITLEQFLGIFEICSQGESSEFNGYLQRVLERTSKN